MTQGNEHVAGLTNVQTATCLATLTDFSQPVTSATWAPDGQTYVTGSMDEFMIQWDLQGKILRKEKSPRVYDLKITPDGQRIVAVDNQKHLHVYDFHDWTNKVPYDLGVGLTCVNVSRDSRHVMVNTGAREVQLIDIETGKVVQRYLGQLQGMFVIRGCFGGADENFVVSGSEGTIYNISNDTTTLTRMQTPISTYGTNRTGHWWRSWQDTLEW